MSMPWMTLWRRNSSRATLFARLLLTAIPTFLEAATPRRGYDPPFGTAKSVMSFPRILTPPS